MSCMNETCPIWVVLHANESCHVRMSQVTNQKLLKVWINVNDCKDCNFAKKKIINKIRFFLSGHEQVVGKTVDNIDDEPAKKL